LLKIGFHPAYIHKLPTGHRFPMEKYELIPLQLLHEGSIERSNLFAPDRVDPALIRMAHQADYVQALLGLSLDPKMVRRIGFPMSQELVDRERYLIDATIQCCHYAQQFGVSMNVAGGTHHAGYDFGEGFCLLNDQAIAAAYLYQRKVAQRILIIDLDVHQGNGTAHIFRGHPAIFTFSMHGEKNYPFVKEPSDRDIGLADDISEEAYLAILQTQLNEIFALHQPDFVFYQAGVDILATDKLGKLKMSIQTCRMRDRLVFAKCQQAQVPVQVSMGGGYSTHIRDIVEAHCNTYREAIHCYNF